jgi:isoleucyl-tRNA synthetase
MYDFKALEHDIASFWEKEKLYHKVRKMRADGPKFYFVDGPPYATGEIHVGTVWNKSMKDCMIRYLRGRGYDVRDQPGFDTHGLPIEVKVEKLLEIRNKNEIEKVGIERFIKECRGFADKYIEVIKGQFSLFGIWMDWENPYVTYKDDYIEKTWETLKRAHEQGLMHRGKYVIPYCYRCGTTLANYELEYGDAPDPSIFVKFKVRGKENEYLIIWTTTPWTLVANMAVMAHPEFDYVKVETEGEIWIIAKERLEALSAATKRNFIVKETIKGKDLKGMGYEHPFQDLIGKQYERVVVLNDRFVTLEDGSGLVHTAPGHGPEDFQVGKQYGIEIFCPVGGDGCYTEEAGKHFKGMHVKKANDEILKILEQRGALLSNEKISHRVAHCWRCKTNLIYIATDQWFINITELKPKMKEEAERVKWVPDSAKERFMLFLEGAPDWCISRQRYWGIPLPIWACRNNHIKVIGSKKELGEEVKELHRPYVDKVKMKCPECKEEMERVKDVLDVWFDSGNAVWASLSEADEKRYGNVGDLIIEGHDQIRGWFYSLLGSGLVRYGKSPYKSLMMHGFFLDEKGEKMSKSVGNFIAVDAVKEKYGADAFRLFVLSSAFWDDLVFTWDSVREAYADLDILINLTKYAKMSYSEMKAEGLEPEDRWMLSRVNTTLSQYHAAFGDRKLNEAVKALRKLLVEDLSQFYMKIAKDRISKGENAAAALHTIYYSLFSIVKMLAPISPFVAEHAYQEFFRQREKAESVHMCFIDNDDHSKIDVTLEEAMEIAKSVISASLKLRNDIGINVRWPLAKVFITGNDEKTATAMKYLGNIAKRMTNAKDIVLAQEVKEDCASEQTPYGMVHLPKAVDPGLKAEGLANEVMRRIQQMRKEMKLVEKQGIRTEIEGDGETKEAVGKFLERIKVKTNSKAVEMGDAKGGKEWKIGEKTIKISIKVI